MLENKTLVMIVGPAAIGKSTLMNEVCAQNDDFGRVSGFTTRQPRDNDEPGLYRYLSNEQASALIDQPETVQYAIHPTTSAIYGTQHNDYPKPFNLLDTLSNVADELRDLPFERTVIVSLTTDANTWKQWLLERYPHPSGERTKRIKEAIISIQWSLAQTSHHYWIVNTPGQLNLNARRLISVVKSGEVSTSVPPEATKLLTMAESLLSYK